MYEYMWDKDKNRMVKKKKVRELDKLVGTEESIDISESKIREYIDSDYYVEEEFDKKKLNKELPLPRKDRDVSVDVYIDFMGDYINRLQHGRKPYKSYFLAAPDGFGKKHFVYQAIKEALRHGLEPTRLLDSHRLYEFLDNKDYSKFYEHFTDKDLAFITLGGAPSNTGLIVIKSALEYCERIGVPLLVISRFPPESYYKVDILTSMYIGIRTTKRGNLGAMELAGFNLSGMNMIRDEIRKRMNIEREDLRELKK